MLILRFITAAAILVAAGQAAAGGTLSTGSASAASGSVLCSSGFSPPQCSKQAFDTSLDLAFSGNGFAKLAVANNKIVGFNTIHQEEFANDGLYGNGASWIGRLADNWLKIDLGRAILIDSIAFGRDRITTFNDRDPGRFMIDVASSDNVYANGDESNDANEYTQEFDSVSSVSIAGNQTLQVTFDPPVLANFVKMTFSNSGAAIDEVEVFGKVVADIDIKPGSDPNCFNINGHGVIPVAVLGSATLNVLDIDSSALFFAGLEVRVRGKKGPLCHGEDSNGDQFLDLVCQFEDDASMWTPDSSSEATLAGALFDGTEFEGTDSICVTQ